MRTHRRSRRLRTGAAAVALVAALTGCQSRADGPGRADPDEVSPGAVTDADPGAPVLQIELSGGFVMVGYDFATVPELTVYADGRAVVHGPQIAIFPPPALPNLQVERLDEADLAALVAAARDAGLLTEPPVYGQPGVADLPTTFVRLTVDGQTYEHAANALGVVEGESDSAQGAGTDALLPADGSGLSDPELAARASLAAFVAQAHQIVAATGDGEPYPVTAFGVFAREMPSDLTTPDGMEIPALPWPLDVVLADAQECALIDGEPAQRLLETLAQASTETLYEQGDVIYGAWFRPLLPHESTCADLG